MLPATSAFYAIKLIIKWMTEQYDETVAQHYAAYRPPLHRKILNRLVTTNERFQTGVDIGCGTGHSAIALADYCEEVTALDPSRSMIDQAVSHAKVSYRHGKNGDLSTLPNDQFSVASFAGSLFYAKCDQLKSELLRVLCRDGVVFVYDFELLLDSYLVSGGVSDGIPDSNYNHEENLSDWPEFRPDRVGRDELSLELSPVEIGHVLLANSQYFTAFANRFSTDNPVHPLIAHIQSLGHPEPVQTNIYFSRYAVK